MADDFLYNIIKKELGGVEISTKQEEVGRVVSVGDGVAQIEGLPNAMFSEMVEIQKWPDSGKPSEKIPALILNLEEYLAGVVVLGDDSQIEEATLNSGQAVMDVSHKFKKIRELYKQILERKAN